MNNRKWLKFLLNEEKEEPVYDPKLSLIDERIFDSLDMTSLAESEIKLLMEGRKENVIKKYGKKVSENALETFLNFDEQYRYKHLAWMAKQLASIEIEDDPAAKYGSESVPYTKNWQYFEELFDLQEEKVDEIIGAVGSFVRYGQNMKKRDINQYPNLQSLLDAIQQDVILPKIAKARKERESNPRNQQLIRSSQGTVVYEDERYFVVRPNTVEASCHFGARTRWCIAQEGNNYFAQYTQGDGRAFYFIKDDTRKNEEYNYKMALEVSVPAATYSDETVMYHNIWDRHDEQYEIESDDVYEVISILVAEFEVAEQAAGDMVESIHDHAEANPPESPLADLEKKIEDGYYDGGFLSIGAWLDDYDAGYLSITADVKIEYVIKNADVIEMLQNGDIDVEEAEASMKTAFEDEGVMYEYLNNDVDIGASKWWWPYEEEDHIQVSIGQKTVKTPSPVPLTQDNPNAPTESVWMIEIYLGGWQDRDYGGTYSAAAKEQAEEFCTYMQEEWGERNEMEIMEVLEKHLLRFIPEVAETQAGAFLELRSDFVTGKHEIPNADGQPERGLYYTVDDDDEETSDLNLFMEFTYELNPEYIHLIYNSEDFENASGNMVKKPNLPPSQPMQINRLANHFLVHDLGGTQTVKSHLDKAIYNVYQQAYEYSLRQLKLDFGEEWKESIEDQWVLPAVPEDIGASISLKGNNILAGGTLLSPTQANIELSFALYIPFHKSKAELESIKRMFFFIRDNYDKISSYIGRYLIQYSNPEETRRGVDIMRENLVDTLSKNLLYSVIESQLFLESLDTQLGLSTKRRKQK